MKRAWPTYKHYRRECKTATAVNRYLESIGLEDLMYDAEYLETYIKGHNIEADIDMWLSVDETHGASIQIEWDGDRYEVRVTQYTNVGIAKMIELDDMDMDSDEDAINAAIKAEHQNSKPRVTRRSAAEPQELQEAANDSTL